MVLLPLALFLFALPGLCATANNPVTLDKSETLFSVLAALNTCGYDTELASSDPLRITIRGEIGRNLENSETAKAASEALCAFYKDHQQAEGVRTLSQYVSLALYLTQPPAFTPKVKEAELPPDASSVMGLVPLLSQFYTEAGLKDIWARHADAYSELDGRYADPFAKMIQETELYLKLPSGSYLGRTFTIYVEPMGAPSAINARSYGSEYYVVLTPGTTPGLKLEQIRHAYLHYLLDPMVGRYAANLQRLEPLLEAVKLAPMDEAFKSDASLLTTECVIRSIEARTLVSGKANA